MVFSTEKRFIESRFRITSATIVILSLLYITCYNPLSEINLNQVKDKINPVITITSPENDSYYASTVVVTGSVTDLSTAVKDAGMIQSLSYEIIPATIEGGLIEYDNNGIFSFQFQTLDFTGLMIIKIYAYDWNNNLTEYSLNLLGSESDIPSFTVVPGNQSVTLSWDDVPLSENYTLFYTTNGAVPSSIYGITISDVSSPLLLPELLNGGIHRFLLLSHSVSGEDNWSAVVDGIPLSPYTLAPGIRNGYKKIHVNWDLPFAASNAEMRFDVFRSTEVDGSYVNRGTFLTNSFTDSDISDDTYYYYKVLLKSTAGIESIVNSGRTSIFPPFKTNLVKKCDTSWAYSIGVYGSYAYVGDLNNGFKVIDISDPENAHIEGACNTNTARGVAIDYPFAFLADGPEGLKVIDVSIPDNPRVVGSCDTIEAMEVAVQDNLLYMADWNAGLVIIDISDPTDPFLITNRVTYTAKSVAVSGDYAYIGDDAGGFKIYNVETPGSPTLAGSCHTNASGTSSAAWGVAVRDSYAYVCDWYEGLKIIDISDKANPTVVIGCDTAYARGVTLSDNFAYVADAWGGLKIINITDPETPVIWAVHPTSNACSAGVLGNIVYVADAEEGLKIIDFFSPDFPVTYASIGTTDARSAAIDEKYAYVADYLGGLKIINIEQPDNPVSVGSCQTYQAQGVTIAGDIAYLSDSNEGLKVINISDRSSPSVIGSVDTVSAIETAVLGNYAYVADYVSGIKVIDVSIPEDPKVIGSCSTFQARSIVADDSFAYVADYMEGLKILDITSPSDPYVLSSLSTGLSASYGIAKSGNYVYIADDNGLKVVNIQDPKVPVLVNVTPYSNPLYGVTVDGSYIYAVGNEETPRNNKGVFIFDISDPENPFLTGEWNDNAVFTRDIVVSSQYAFVSDGTGGLKVLNLLSGTN